MKPAHTVLTFFMLACLALASVGAESVEASATRSLPIVVQHIPFAGQCAIEKGDSTLRCWDDRGEDVATPQGEFLSVRRAGEGYCALRADGTPTCWGLEPHFKAPFPLPEGKFREVYPFFGRPHRTRSGKLEAGHFCALHEAGDAECWRVEVSGGRNGELDFTARLVSEFRQEGVYVGIARGEQGYWTLLDDKGQITFHSRAGGVPPAQLPASPPGTYAVLLGRGALGTDGSRLLVHSARVLSVYPPEANPLVNLDRCTLRLDGRPAGGRPSQLPGSFFHCEDGCYARTDGRLLGRRCAAHPPDLRVESEHSIARIMQPGLTPVQAMAARTAERSKVEGRPRSYRSAIQGLMEHEWLGVSGRGGWTHESPASVFERDERHFVLEEGADFTVIDLNGEALEYGDPLVLKVGNRFVTATDRGLKLERRKTEASVWSFHDPTLVAEGPVDTELGHRGLYLRAFDGRFLIPGYTKLGGKPEDYGMQRASSRTSPGPFFTEDPRFEDQEGVDGDVLLRKGAYWELWPVTDCAYRLRGDRRDRRAACARKPRRGGNRKLKPRDE